MLPAYRHAHRTQRCDDVCMQLSRSFQLAEFLRSETATRFKIENDIDDASLENLKALVANVLQPLRDAIDQPLRINSGFRTQRLNQKIGGAKNSQHMRGEAADVEATFLDNRALAQTIIDLKLPFDQLILEHHYAEDPRSGWVHVSHSRVHNRGDVITTRRDRFGFVQGLDGIDVSTSRF